MRLRTGGDVSRGLINVLPTGSAGHAGTYKHTRLSLVFGGAAGQSVRYTEPGAERAGSGGRGATFFSQEKQRRGNFFYVTIKSFADFSGKKK